MKKVIIFEVKILEKLTPQEHLYLLNWLNVKGVSGYTVNYANDKELGLFFHIDFDVFFDFLALFNTVNLVHTVIKLEATHIN